MSTQPMMFTQPRRSNQWFEEGEREVDNPYALTPDLNRDKSLPPEPKTHTVKVNVRETAVEYLFARGKIDKDHKDASDWLRERLDRARIGAIGAIDPEQPFSKRYSRSTTDRAVDASKELASVRTKIGPVFFWILIQACAVGLSLGEIANQYLFGTEPGTNAHEVATGATTRILIIALDQLVLVLKDDLIRTPRGSISKKSHFYKNYSRSFGTLASDPALWGAIPDDVISKKIGRKKKGPKK